MKKCILFFVCLTMAIGLFAQDRIVERTFVSSDRSVYVAGDDLWCSAFCIDVTDGGHLSDFSSVCYVELVGVDGPVANCKIALDGGRGAGHLRIPVSVPSGNYRLLAYTATNRNEIGMDYLQSSRVISVYNTLSNNRTQGTVLADKLPDTQTLCESTGSDIHLNRSEDGRIIIQNVGKETASVALSVACSDNLKDPNSLDIHGFVETFSDFRPSGVFSYERVPEYDGEIVYMHVPAELAGSTGFISSPGNKSNIYTSDVDDAGRLVFYTGNIYGETNMVLQFDYPSLSGDYQLEVESPFIAPQVSAGDLPELVLSPEMEDDLLRRSVAMQISDKFGTEILYSNIPERLNLLFTANSVVTYNLEDYTRFQTFREIFLEYVKQASVRHGQICVTLNDVVLSNSLQSTVSSTTLVLIDGVPVLDHEIALSMDPSLVRRLEIFQRSIAVGSRVYGGAVNFVTLREDMAGVKLPESSRMLDFNGVCYPVALTGERIDSNYPDYRQTLLWQPLLKLEPGETIELNCVLPAYEGEFRASVVGMTCSGKPLSSSVKL